MARESPPTGKRLEERPGPRPVASSISRQINLSLVLVVVFWILAIGGFLIVFGFHSYMELMRRLLQERCRTASVEIGRYLEDVHRKLGYLARVQGLAEFPEDTQKRLLEGLIRHHSVYENVMILDSSGTITCHLSTRMAPVESNYATTVLFQRAFHYQEDYVGPVSLEPVTHNLLVQLAVPIRDAMDEVRGVLVADVNLKFLGFLVSRIQVGETGYAFVLDQRNYLIAEKDRQPEDFRHYGFPEHTFTLEYPQLREHPVVAYRGLKDVRVLGTYHSIPSVQWRVVIELPTHEAYAPLRRLLVLLGIALGLAALAALAIGVYFSRKIVLPLRQLTLAAARIRAGHLDTRVHVTGASELDLLARTFNEMTERLNQLFSDLEKEIQERREAVEAHRESEERYALAVRGANDGLWDWNLKSNTVYLSPRWKSILGYGDDEISDHPEEWLGRAHPEDTAKIRGAIAAHLENQTPHLECEHRIRNKQGEYRWVLARGLAVRDETGKALRLAGSLTDVTLRKRSEEQLLHDAFHDALTGLPNRALFLDRLDQVLSRRKRHQEGLFAVLFLDLDRFKIVNDSLGHLAGDEMLVQVSRRLVSCLRPGDTVARMGGDEFTILLDDLQGPAEATRVADRLQHALAAPFRLQQRELFTSASIGIALVSKGYERPEEVLRDADTALYRAKAKGRAGREVFDETMHAGIMARLELETDLRQAIRQKEFRILYQPIYSIKARRIVGFEALVRWEHPRRGTLDPAVFMPVAEETGLMVSIGRYVFRKACNQLRKWHLQFPQNPPLSVSVNLAFAEFRQFDLVRQIDQVLRETGLDPSALVLEITEGVVMDDAGAATAVLLHLKDLGLRLSIDDFGTGYSSLSSLHQLPIDALKIDRSFVMRLLDDKESPEIISTIFALAEKLDVEVIAEGVETAEQLARLENMGCDYIQGYYIARPLEVEDVGRLIRCPPRLYSQGESSRDSV
jgi:diguanylate cyclase (GGDEF)-like protein/PAS domain S-box-containing protein